MDCTAAVLSLAPSHLPTNRDHDGPSSALRPSHTKLILRSAEEILSGITKRYDACSYDIPRAERCRYLGLVHFCRPNVLCKCMYGACGVSSSDGEAAKQYLEEVRLDGRDSRRKRVRSFNPRMVHSKRNAMRRGAVYKNDPCMSTDTAASTDTL